MPGPEDSRFGVEHLTTASIRLTEPGTAVPSPTGEREVFRKCGWAEATTKYEKKEKRRIRLFFILVKY